MALVYLACVAGGVAVVVFRMEVGKAQEVPAAFAMAWGMLLVVMGLVFAGLFAAGLFLPPRPGVWIYGIILITIGFSSACCMPFCIPLLIYWLKPETRVYFGRSPD